jgi:hypothetical protein
MKNKGRDREERVKNKERTKKRPLFPAISLSPSNDEMDREKTILPRYFPSSLHLLEKRLRGSRENIKLMKKNKGKDGERPGGSRIPSFNYPSILLSFLDSSFPYPLGNEKDSEKTILSSFFFPSPHSPFPLFLMKKIREKTGKNGPKTSMERYSSF